MYLNIYIGVILQIMNKKEQQCEIYLQDVFNLSSDAVLSDNFINAI